MRYLTLHGGHGPAQPNGFISKYFSARRSGRTFSPGLVLAPGALLVLRAACAAAAQRRRLLSARYQITPRRAAATPSACFCRDNLRDAVHKLIRCGAAAHWLPGGVQAAAAAACSQGNWATQNYSTARRTPTRRRRRRQGAPRKQGIHPWNRPPDFTALLTTAPPKEATSVSAKEAANVASTRPAATRRRPATRRLRLTR